MTSDKTITEWSCTECPQTWFMDAHPHDHLLSDGETYCSGRQVARVYVAVDALLSDEAVEHAVMTRRMAHYNTDYEAARGVIGAAIEHAKTGEQRP